jgi:TonB family protein
MSDLWKQCEGQFVDNQFPLLQFLANTNHSAVFLTELRSAEPRNAAIKFISADIPAPDQQLALWQRVQQLSHPHLLQIFRHGRCRLAGMELLYVIMERADEDLAQFLPQRALKPEEVRDLLDPLVDTLGYLHTQGLAHSHIKPSNLLAVADQLKLSSDTILPLREFRESNRDHDIYDAPENVASSTIIATSPADVWSLGITLVEALTQQAPPLPFDDSAEPAVPETLPQPFLEIARHSLLRDPARRWTIAGIASHLNPALLTAAATASATASSTPATPSAATIPVPPMRASTRDLAPASIPPLSVPLSTEPAVPLAKLPPPPKPAFPRYVQTVPDKTISLPSYVIPFFLVVVLALGTIFVLPKIFRRLSSQSASTAPVVAPAAPKSNPPTPAKSAANPAPQRSSEPISPTVSVEPKPAPAASRPAESAPVRTIRNASSPDRGEVLDQVLPEASSKALSTIQGTVRVVVRVHVDPVGKVSSADLDSPGPSKYFANLALRAAQQWEFTSPVSEGHSLPSQWLIRFEFSPTGVVAIPAQTMR